MGDMRLVRPLALGASTRVRLRQVKRMSFEIQKALLSDEVRYCKDAG
jgi:hypothetical protein